MSARIREERGLWYVVESRDGRRTLRRSFGRGVIVKAAAEEAAAEINRERALEKLGLIQASTGVRFSEYAERWLREVVEPHKSTGTARNYDQLVRDHLTPEFGGLSLSEIKPRHVQAFIAKKLNEQWGPATKTKRDEPAPQPPAQRRARNTVRNMAAVLRALLNHAVEVDEIIQSNPAAKFGKRFFDGAGARGIRIEVYEEHEVATILETARKLYPGHELLVRTLFYTGLRVGELLGLQWGDWDFRGGYVMVRRKVKVHKKHLLVEDTKTHRVRPVDVPDTLLERWGKVRSVREAEAAVAGYALSPWCSPSARDPRRPLNASWFNHKVWARILHHAKLRRLPVKDTRHTYASLMLKQGKPMEYVQRQLGHEKIDTTIRFYSHFRPGVNRGFANDFADRIERLEAAATPPEPDIHKNDRKTTAKRPHAAEGERE